MEIADYDKSLIYQPPPADAEKFNKKLIDITGTNPLTGGPFIRFVWGMDRVEFCDGEWQRRYPDPDGKYVGLPFFVLEGWQHPKVFNRTEWDESVLGEFPEQGEWDFISVLRTPEHEYIGLNNKAIDFAKQWKHWKLKKHSVVLADLFKRRARIKHLREQRWQAKKQEVFDQLTEDVIRAVENDNKPEFSLPQAKEDGKFTRLPSGVLVPNH